MTASLGSVPGELMDWAAGVIGISPAIVRAQINEESGGNPGAVSPTGAQGVAQFEPGTWTGEGCKGSPFNVNDAMRCYAKYMYQLVKQFHGNVRDALAAYNAGPGNLAAGYGYADTILAAAGQPQTVTAKGGSGAAGSAPSTQGSSAPDAKCALSLGGQHVGILFGHGPTLPSTCLIRKTEVRAFLGALILVGGALITLPGLVVVLAYGFRASGAARAVSQAASVVPGPVGRVGRVTRVAALPDPAVQLQQQRDHGDQRDDRGDACADDPAAGGEPFAAALLVAFLLLLKVSFEVGQVTGDLGDLTGDPDDGPGSGFIHFSDTACQLTELPAAGRGFSLGHSSGAVVRIIGPPLRPRGITRT